VIWLLIIMPLVALIAGAASGFVIGTRQMPRMLARMSPADVDELADRVRELRNGPG
jgi:uncharacterized protein YneF (UPF0154 family)